MQPFAHRFRPVGRLAAVLALLVALSPAMAMAAAAGGSNPGSGSGSSAGVTYSLLAETIDAGGRRGISANYTNDGSIGGVNGLVVAAPVAEIVRNGYAGQLYDVTALSNT